MLEAGRGGEGINGTEFGTKSLPQTTYSHIILYTQDPVFNLQYVWQWGQLQQCFGLCCQSAAEKDLVPKYHGVSLPAAMNNTELVD